MSFFDAVFSSGISIPEDLMNQAKSLIQQIGPYVEDQEYLQLICLLQMLKPPKKWIDPVSRKDVNTYFPKDIERGTNCHNITISISILDDGIFKSSAKKSNQTLRKVLDIDPQAFEMENQTR